jgi:hypothetical protein
MVMGSIVASDVVFYSHDEDHDQSQNTDDTYFKAYHDQTGEQLNFGMKQVMSRSILGKMLKS